MFTLFHTVHQIETDVSFGFIGKQRLYGTIWIKGVASNDTKYRKTVYRSWKQIMSLWIILSRSSVFVLPTMLNRMKKICNTLVCSVSAVMVDAGFSVLWSMLGDGKELLGRVYSVGVACHLNISPRKKLHHPPL